MNNTTTIEIAYATAEKQLIINLEVAQGTTAREAVRLSGITLHFPEIDLDACDLGVFGKAINEDYVLVDADRIEIYRPLIADPKEVRRKRAEKGLQMKKGGGAAV